MLSRISIILLSAIAANLAPAMYGKDASYLLGTNDRISIRCLNAEEFTPTPIRIDGDGRVTLPLIGRIKLGGLSVSEAEQEVAGALSHFIRNPEVSLTLIERYSQPVSVLGAVNKPGTYQLEGEKRLSEILAAAGGLRADAGPTLRITRRRSAGPLSLPGATTDPSGEYNVAEVNIDDVVQGKKPALDVTTEPFDVISVPQADIVYVVGQVRKPGGFTMTGHGGMSVLQALSLAEGLDRTAAPKSARIIRRTGVDSRQDIPIDLKTILTGKADDIFLRANDVLFVPNNAAKSAGTRTLDAVIQAATGIVIYGRY